MLGSSCRHSVHGQILGRIFSRPPDIADGTLPFSDVQADHRKDHQRQKRPPKRFALSLASLRPRRRNRVDDGKFLGTKTGCGGGKIPFSIVKQACREFRRKDQSCLSLRKGVRSTSGIAIRVLHIRTRLPQCPVLQFPRLGGRMHIYYEWSEAKHADNTS